MKIDKTIMMKSPVFIVTKILKKTKAKGLENVKIGTKIQFQKTLKRAGYNRDTGTYAAYLDIVNLDTNEKNVKSFNQVSQVFDLWEVEQLDD